MTKTELLAALAGVPDDAPIVLDVGLEGFFEVVVLVDDAGEGVRIIPDPADEEAGQLLDFINQGVEV